MKSVNPNASALGKLAAGKPKRYSEKEIKLRTARLVEARKAKAEKKQKEEEK